MLWLLTKVLHSADAIKASTADPPRSNISLFFVNRFYEKYLTRKISMSSYLPTVEHSSLSAATENFEYLPNEYESDIPKDS